jgi:iron(III) transport system permease protein
VIKLPAALSPVIVGIGFVLAFGGPPFFLGGTFLIILLCYIVLFIPQATTATDAAVAQIDRQLREAAQVAGARAGRIFLRINLPLLLPGLIGSWGLLFVWMVGELNASVMLAGTQMPVVGFQILQAFQHGGFAQLASLSVALTFVNIVALTLAGLAGKLGSLRAN